MEVFVVKLVSLLLASVWIVEADLNTSSCIPCFNFYLESCDGSMKFNIGQVQLGPGYMQAYKLCYGCSQNDVGDVQFPALQAFQPPPGVVGINGIPQSPFYTGQPELPLYGNGIPHFGQPGVRNTFVNPGGPARSGPFFPQQPANFRSFPSPNGYLTTAEECEKQDKIVANVQPVQEIKSVEQKQESNVAPPMKITANPHAGISQETLSTISAIPLQTRSLAVDNSIPLTNPVTEKPPQTSKYPARAYNNFDDIPSVRSSVPQNPLFPSDPAQNYMGYLPNYLYPALNTYPQQYYNLMRRLLPNMGLNYTVGPLQGGFHTNPDYQRPYLYPYPANNGYGFAPQANGPPNRGAPPAAGLTNQNYLGERSTSSAAEENISPVNIERVS